MELLMFCGNTLNYLTLYKQMSNVEYNCVKWQYLKPFNCVQMKLLVLVSYTWNLLTAYKQMSSGCFRMLPTNYLFTNHTYFVYLSIYIYIYIYI